MTMQQLEGKVAFITGGGTGIGLGMAHSFVRAGMKVVIASRRRKNLDAAMASFKGGGAVHAIEVDVADREAMVRAADEAERVFGKVHVLCNNAGLGLGPAPLMAATYDDWDWVMSVNLGGVINGVVTFLPRILRHGEGGHIVNTSSMNGIVPSAQRGLYSTVKFGVVGLSDTLRMELAADNIGVTTFCPGPVNTNIAEGGETRPARYAKTGYWMTFEQRKAFSYSPMFMDADECGEMVLDAVRQNLPYVFTHAEFREGFQRRFDAIQAAFPERVPDPELQAVVNAFIAGPSAAGAPHKAEGLQSLAHD
jgi:NAD(P)-dependent dehydrogenase (short-subunit alcohol dehydrogenase family)